MFVLALPRAIVPRSDASSSQSASSISGVGVRDAKPIFKSLNLTSIFEASYSVLVAVLKTPSKYKPKPSAKNVRIEGCSPLLDFQIAILFFITQFFKVRLSNSTAKNRLLSVAL